MRAFSAFAVACLTSVLVIDTASAFVANLVTTLSHVSMSKGSVTRTSPVQLRSMRSFGALRMADNNAMDAAAEEAKELNDKAAALREEAAASEAAIRPPNEEVAPTDEAEDAPEIRPEDMPPSQKISNNMKDRLTKELQSQGADPNKSAGNPILVVAAVIGILVIVGGQGIFY